ncbi:MAG: acetyltransferase [Flavobacteriaceae bacterium]|nr:MAG: acetyltransferase [Flavobacteriaceae bacterium]
MYLYGASGHCKVIIDSIQSSTSKVIEGVFDDTMKGEILNIPIIEFKGFDKDTIKEIIISVGNNSTRKKLAALVPANFISVIHKNASVSKHALIGVGTAIMSGAVVNAAASIGKHCIVNSRAVVEHDCVLEDYVHISPNASLAGNVKVGKGSHIGIGATIIQGITIGKWATVGAGAVIIKDVSDGAVMVGNPARNIKK